MPEMAMKSPSTGTDFRFGDVTYGPHNVQAAYPPGGNQYHTKGKYRPQGVGNDHTPPVKGKGQLKIHLAKSNGDDTNHSPPRCHSQQATYDGSNESIYDPLEDEHAYYVAPLCAHGTGDAQLRFPFRRQHDKDEEDEQNARCDGELPKDEEDGREGATRLVGNI
jgi:hypothetical protein